MITIPMASILLASLMAAQGGAAQPRTLLADARPGLNVTIVDERGTRLEGRLVTVSDSVVRITRRGRSRDIPLDEVVRIEQQDKITNGAMIGFGAGIALVLTVTLAEPHGVHGRFVAASAVGNGIIWAALGALVDGLADNRHTLYERGARTQVRVSPSVGHRTRSLAVTLTW